MPARPDGPSGDQFEQLRPHPAARHPAPLAAKEHAGGAEMFDQLARKAFAARFRGPRDPLVERLVEQCCGSRRCPSWVGCLQVSFDFPGAGAALPRRRSGSVPGIRTRRRREPLLTPRATRATNSLRAPASSGPVELGGDHQTGPRRAAVGADGHHRALPHPANLGGHAFDLRGKHAASGHRDEAP